MDPNKVEVVVGPPGTGKTTYLLSLVEKALAAGTSPREVGFISFTKKAATEGINRAVSKFSLPPEDFPHFRTLHSEAFRFLRLSRDRVFGWPHIRELGAKLGIEFKGREVRDDDVYGMGSADRLLFLEGLARNSMRPLRTIWEEAAEDAVDWWELDRFARALVEYKKARMLLDFTDMLEKFCEAGPTQMPRLKLLLIDEAQDLSLLQWRAIEMMAEQADEVHVSGDDLQGIYEWSGSDIGTFINLAGSTRTLDVSYRIPSLVHKLSEEIYSRVANKRPRSWKPRSEVGAINWLNDIGEVDLAKGTWLLLARNGYMLDEVEDHCLASGFSFHSVNRDPLRSPALEAIKIWEDLRKDGQSSAGQLAKAARFASPRSMSPILAGQLRRSEPSTQYSMPQLRASGLNTDDIWHRALDKIPTKERDYFLAARRRGEKLLGEPRIQISTIHASKGGEAQNVLLLTDMSLRCHQNMSNNPDAENRVWYVAATRCFESLNLVSPRTNLCYEL